MTETLDPTAIAGKVFPVATHVPLVVVGGGPAGLAAAIEAASLGVGTMLIDENPVGAGLIGMDVPLAYGERLDAAVRNKPRMLERIVAARPEIERAFEAGVDVQLGVYAWGAFVSGPTSRAQPRPLLGLADDDRSWLVSWDRLIVAAGARDVGLAMPGWDRPGVMGARAFAAAVDLYGAFNGRRLVILGSGAIGLATALKARDAGLDVAAVVEVADAPQGPAALVERVRAAGVPILTRRTVAAIEGAAEVERVTLRRADDGAATEIACDTLVTAIDMTPNVELFDLLGCRIAWRGDAGGFVPETDGDGRTSSPAVLAVGDCTGIADAALLDPEIAAAAGRRAARIAAADLGVAVNAGHGAPWPLAAGERDPALRRWLAAQAAAEGGGGLVLCRCENVTLRDLVGVRPPGYLEYDPRPFEERNLLSLAADGPLNQDQLKRLTRAGMGPCQGRRCREQVQAAVALRSNAPTGSVPLPSFRAPLRPLPLSVMSADDESAELRANWTAWFGIAAQWLPHWEKAPEEAEFWGGRVPIPDVQK
ncbi:MAG: FAD-dependent oxidoreductase [Alphaproteobacteria bacterium]